MGVTFRKIDTHAWKDVPLGIFGKSAKMPPHRAGFITRILITTSAMQHVCTYYFYVGLRDACFTIQYILRLAESQKLFMLLSNLAISLTDHGS